ncbi:hypothetical protein [Microbacterium sp.]|uniref:hypothetical protein n=1 Tax=Microbacterium sp. TaxID=51671 RepID=UPI0028121116|nr:hypothetical protein [Microbacterium sp.]
MPEIDWTNDELRAFLTALRNAGIFGIGEEDLDREGFRRQALRRIVPGVQRRVLAQVGAVVDPLGVAAVALEVVNDTAWEPEHTWLMVTKDPWRYLADVVSNEIRRAYRKAVRPDGDADALAGIEKASSRLEIGAEGDAAGAA